MCLSVTGKDSGAAETAHIGQPLLFSSPDDIIKADRTKASVPDGTGVFFFVFGQDSPGEDEWTANIYLLRAGLFPDSAKA